MREERMNMSQRERDRLKVVQAVEEGHLKQTEAAQRLEALSTLDSVTMLEEEKFDSLFFNDLAGARFF